MAKSQPEGGKKALPEKIAGADAPAGEKSRRYLSAPKTKKGKKGGERTKLCEALSASGNPVGFTDTKTNSASATSTDTPITRQTNIMDLVHNYPEAVPVLIEAGLHCIGCQLSFFDTVEQGCALHGMDEETVDRMVKEMNERVKNFRK